MPLYSVVLGEGLTALGFWITFAVFRENTFTSATVGVFQGHRVISTGPYALVRHPMYAGGAMVFFGTPLALASYWGLFASLATLPVLGWRTVNEEKYLLRNLPGYREYCAKVPWRLIPGLF